MEMTENDRNMSLFEKLLEHVCSSGYRKFPVLTASEGKGCPPFLSYCSPDSLEVSWKAGVHFQLCLFIPAFVMQLLAMQFIIHSFTIFLFVLFFFLYYHQLFYFFLILQNLDTWFLVFLSKRKTNLLIHVLLMGSITFITVFLTN